LCLLGHFQAKQEALREDANVFDVSFEGQGDESVVASATDVKVCIMAHLLCACALAVALSGLPLAHRCTT
jgi:hypothetical protein